jgi:hypothetical protein
MIDNDGSVSTVRLATSVAKPDLCSLVCLFVCNTCIFFSLCLFQAPFEVQKRLDEVRLLESRKSARLADQDTDFARLADMAGDRKRTASHTIDVPVPSSHLGYVVDLGHK